MLQDDNFAQEYEDTQEGFNPNLNPGLFPSDYQSGDWA
jgi:hypothetical protein